jgi:hypothetical protein
MTRKAVHQQKIGKHSSGSSSALSPMTPVRVEMPEKQAVKNGVSSGSIEVPLYLSEVSTKYSRD